MEQIGSLSSLDYLIFVLYFSLLIGMSWKLGKGQHDQADYYVSGRKMPWWAIGISTAATQTSAIGFMSIPAFVAMKPGGGMKLLQGEFALPLAMIFVMVFLIPFFRKLELISVYEYLDMRFNSSAFNNIYPKGQDHSLSKKSNKGAQPVSSESKDLSDKEVKPVEDSVEPEKDIEEKEVIVEDKKDMLKQDEPSLESSDNNDDIKSVSSETKIDGSDEKVKTENTVENAEEEKDEKTAEKVDKKDEPDEKLENSDTAENLKTEGSTDIKEDNKEEK